MKKRVMTTRAGASTTGHTVERSSCLERPPGDWRINPRLAADPLSQEWSDPAREREKLRTASGDVDIEDPVMEPYTVSASFVAQK
jgi:hypothetical protein